jgi:hypothetical protein
MMKRLLAFVLAGALMAPTTGLASESAFSNDGARQAASTGESSSSGIRHSARNSGKWSGERMIGNVEKIDTRFPRPGEFAAIAGIQRASRKDDEAVVVHVGTCRHRGDIHDPHSAPPEVLDPRSAMRIVEMVQHEFPQAKLLVRSYDRGHAVELIRAGVDYQIRETAESAYLLGAEGLRALGFVDQDVAEADEDIRRRDEERLSA